MPYPEKHINYDDEPIVFCSRCYSLKIKYEEAIDSDCCMDCGCSDILETSIDNWERLYEKRYGHKYVVKNNNPKDSMIFKLSLNELKEKVYKNPSWKEIIHCIYPHFPGGLGKADSIILFFDKLIKDNKIDALRYTLLNNGY